MRTMHAGRETTRGDAPVAPAPGALRSALGVPLTRRAHSAASMSGSPRASSSSAGAPPAIKRSRHSSTRLKCSASRALTALRARARRGSARVHVAHQLADVLALAGTARAAADAAGGAYRRGQLSGRSSAASSASRRPISSSPRSWAACAARLRALLLGRSAAFRSSPKSSAVRHRADRRRPQVESVALVQFMLNCHRARPSPSAGRRRHRALADVVSLALEEARRQGASQCEADASVSRGSR